MDVDKGILKIVGERNEKRFVIATQDTELRKKLREVPGVPLIYLNRAVPVLEKQSQASIDFQNGVEKKKQAPSKWERRKLHEQHTRNSTKSSSSSSSSSSLRRKRKGPKNPNPLSVPKKKKIKTAASTSSTGESGDMKKKKKKKKRRKRKKKSEATTEA